MYLTLSGNGSRAARTEVLQSKSVAADRRAFPSSGAGRLSDAHGRRRQLQRRQSHRCGGRLGRENVFGEQVLQGRLRQELQSHHRRGLRHGTLPRARRALQPAAVGHGGSGALQVHRLHVLPRGSSHHCGLRPEQRELLSPRQWLEDAMRENDPSSVLLFLVGTKKDLSSPEQLAQVEEEAVRTSEELGAEYWAVSAKSGDGVRDFFLRVASLTFEANVLSELEKQNGNTTDVISESPSLLHRAVWRPGMSTFATCVHFSQQ
ncbi:uncharacterized protein LOC133491490 isoform X8 [Syngnathoides biaculeatus]|uniref:uncharacterized protein LOC133491490 isoform X8 n=1 Tax=Syngnathoides biaculeatus TaxID=300417 RepID=UPI002ADE69E5|nr:uncharacterized protein LOC133491490 isoform X8 [Syngnathoides biaculeatus]